ncbi:unnamed protein product [Amoebophrya sp. A120]|nr:unnamed protein product [Amoebophrya sp. A120]|eukprot:GSA120T00006510001.1
MAASCTRPLASLLQSSVPAGLELYGENLSAVHSIRYEPEVKFPFYLFAVRLDGLWLSWDRVEHIAKKLRLPLVPVKYKGPALSLEELERRMATWAQEPSGILFCENDQDHEAEEMQQTGEGGAQTRLTRPEGFVVRTAGTIRDFSANVAKYVRANHLQTAPDFKRTWQRQRIRFSDMGEFLEYERDDPHKETSSVEALPSASGPGSDSLACTQGGEKKMQNEQTGNASSNHRHDGEDARSGKNAGEKSSIAACAPRTQVRLVVLVGLPGSGKSSFVSRLRAGFLRCGYGPPIVLSQDEIGREGVEGGIGAAWKSVANAAKSSSKKNDPALLVVDRTNLLQRDRLQLLDLCFQPPKESVLCVYFPADAETCTERVQLRMDHPSIPFGRGRKVVESFIQRGIESPDMDDGLYHAVVRCASHVDVDITLQNYFGVLPLPEKISARGGFAQEDEQKPHDETRGANACEASAEDLDCLRTAVQKALLPVDNAWPARKIYWFNDEREVFYVHAQEARGFPRVGHVAGLNARVRFFPEYEWLDEEAAQARAAIAGKEVFWA